MQNISTLNVQSQLSRWDILFILYSALFGISQLVWKLYFLLRLSFGFLATPITESNDDIILEKEKDWIYRKH
jgi:hypothetical protein